MFSFVVLASLIGALAGHSADEWRSKTIYQVVTDRFARNNGDISGCSDLRKHCGGGWRGLINNLDYIQGMGFDAVWISPIVKNYGDNYHGYAATDFYSLNEHFGTEQDFKDLVSALHSRGMWIMVDVVANHIAGIGTDLSKLGIINPFNQKEHYHNYCPIHWGDTTSEENCWLFDLPDLNQENPWVRQELKNWIKWMVDTYDLDGIRIDTCIEVPKTFWGEFAKASGVFSMCEAFDGNNNLSKVASYQNYLDSTLNYPFSFTIRDGFMYNRSLYGIRDYYERSKAAFRDIHLLGNFVDNHDTPRFLSINLHYKRFQSAIALSFLFPGIPVLYYGDEQAYAGGNDPYNREIMWTNLNTSSEMYNFVKTLIHFRQEMEIWKYDFVERYAADNFYAFSRGKALFAFSNVDTTVNYYVSYHPYSVGDVLCNALWATDCVTVTSAGVPVVLVGGEVKLYRPKNFIVESA